MSLSTATEAQLSRTVVAGTVVLYYKHVEFPDSIYIALANSYDRGIGTVINPLDDMEQCVIVPMAKIDELVLNIPAREDFNNYIEEKFGVSDPAEFTAEMEMDFWNAFRWQFSTQAVGYKIEWVE